MLSRGQAARQLVYLLGASSALGGSTSAIQSTLPIEVHLASSLTLPIACVQTLDAENDQEVRGRWEVARYRMSIAALASTEARASNYLGAGGTGSSQRPLENTIRDILSYLGNGLLNDSQHGLRGVVTVATRERLVVAQGKTYAVADFDVELYDCNHADVYHDGDQLRASSSGQASGAILVLWNPPPARFDRYRYVLRRSTSPSSTPPTSISDGTGVTLSSFPSSVTVTGLTPGATYAFALFIAYDPNSSTPAADTYVSAGVTTTGAAAL